MKCLLSQQGILRGGGAVIVALALAPAVSAEEVTVTEGETAKFSVVATYNGPTGRTDNLPSKIRVSYKTVAGTATAGSDFEAIYSWSSAGKKEGAPGSAITLQVETFEDDAQEEDETFSIQVHRLELWIESDFWSAGGIWQAVSIGENAWNLEYSGDAVIEDATAKSDGT